MLRFPLDGLLDEQDCYEFLLRILHPDGLYCPRSHPLPASQASHRRRRPIIPDYRCRQCGAVFNLFTSTIWWKTCYRCSTIVQILRGIAQGTPTQHLADELAINRTHLLERRHEIRTLVASHFSLTTPLSDPVAEADELYQNAGEKGRKHTDPSDPPRRRANQGAWSWNLGQ